MKFKLEIELGDDATFATIATQLEDFAQRFTAPVPISNVISGTGYGSIPDASGNTAGKWEVVDSD